MPRCTARCAASRPVGRQTKITSWPSRISGASAEQPAVGGTAAPPSYRKLLKSLGITPAVERNARLMAMLNEAQMEGFLKFLDDHGHFKPERKRSERAALRKYVAGLPLVAFPPEDQIRVIELLYPNFVWPEEAEAADG